MAFRVWNQLASGPFDTDSERVVLSVTEDLASPFQIATGAPPDSRNGVIDYTTLVAMEGYFFAMLVLITLILILRRLSHYFERSRKLDGLISKIESEGHRSPLWQPVVSPRHQGARFYVPVHRRTDTAARSMEWLAYVRGSTSFR
jgi:hypothetical protein